MVTNLKNAILLLLFLISSKTFAQTFSETSQWINNNSKGSYQIFYDKNSKSIEIINIFYDAFPGIEPRQGAYLQVFNPNDVSNISTMKNEDGYFLRINFKPTGTLVYKWNRGAEEYLTKTQMYAFDVFLKTDNQTIQKFKKAFIKLFRQLKVPAKDGDLF
jgi:hypothetical protein